MIYANMAKFQIASVEQVVKVGDTVADIQEGKHAGVLSLGVLEGSSVMGYTQAEYEALPQAERQAEKDRGPGDLPGRRSGWGAGYPGSAVPVAGERAGVKAGIRARSLLKRGTRRPGGIEGKGARPYCISRLVRLK